MPLSEVYVLMLLSLNSSDSFLYIFLSLTAQLSLTDCSWYPRKLEVLGDQAYVCFFQRGTVLVSSWWPRGDNRWRWQKTKFMNWSSLNIPKCIAGVKIHYTIVLWQQCLRNIFSFLLLLHWLINPMQTLVLSPRVRVIVVLGLVCSSPKTVALMSINEERFSLRLFSSGPEFWLPLV